VKGGSKIIELRGRSSFQSPAHHSVLMLRAILGGGDYDWPCGVYIDKGEFKGVVMAANTKIKKGGMDWQEPVGTPDDMKELRASAEHLKKLRQEAVTLGILPDPAKWGELNKHLAQG
jgi:malate dehydrogenase